MVAIVVIQQPPKEKLEESDAHQSPSLCFSSFLLTFSHILCLAKPNNASFQSALLSMDIAIFIAVQNLHLYQIHIYQINLPLFLLSIFHHYKLSQNVHSNVSIICQSFTISNFLRDILTSEKCCLTTTLQSNLIVKRCSLKYIQLHFCNYYKHINETIWTYFESVHVVQGSC